MLHETLSQAMAQVFVLYCGFSLIFAITDNELNGLP